MARLRDTGDTRDTDVTAAPVGVKIASAVSAATAAELVGLPAHRVDYLEREVAEHGVFGIGNLKDNYEVRLSRDD